MKARTRLVTINLIHHPGELDGVFSLRDFGVVAVNLAHHPDKLEGVVFTLLNSYPNAKPLRGEEKRLRPWVHGARATLHIKRPPWQIQAR